MNDGVAERDAAPVRKGEQYHHPDLREAMIQVAQELLESEGPGSWTVRAAARIAGVSSGAPYRHFADKDALISAVAARGYEALGQAMHEELDAAGSAPAARLDALCRAYMVFARARPGRYQVMFGRGLLDRTTQTELSVAASRTYELLLAEVRAGQAAGKLRTDKSAERLATTLWSMLHGAADLQLSRLSEPDESVDGQLGALLLAGLAARS
jgi:AcrR family transcriptional regulator